MTHSADETSAMLMRLAADGDEVAFARIVDTHQADMTSVCFVVTGGDAELTRKPSNRHGRSPGAKLDTIRDPERLRPWLISIAVNEARQLSCRRRRGRVLETAVVPDRPAAMSDPASLAGDIDLRNALTRLEPKDRAPLALRYVAGFDSAELAHALGMTPSGTRARLARLLGRLRSELGDG